LSSNELLKSLIVIKNTPMPGNDVECSKIDFEFARRMRAAHPSKEADIVIRRLSRGILSYPKAIRFFSLRIGMPNGKRIDMEYSGR
jgi:hypothetical protein